MPRPQGRAIDRNYNDNNVTAYPIISRIKLNSFEESSRQKMKTESLMQRLWRWFIAPSAQIMKPDDRRQASLLSGLLLGIIVLAVAVESLSIAFIEWENYTGYRQTALGVAMLVIIYAISRTNYVRVAAVLFVFVASTLTFFSGWAQPAGVLGGLFDFLILSLWLGSIYLNFKELWVLILLILIGLLLFPSFTPDVTLNEILVGPFSFIFATSILLIIITRHRDLLEHDRQKMIREKERQSRHEAARTQVLLRVAERLNAQLDLDTLLKAICEEASLALSTPVSFVTLYDKKQDAFYSTTAVGLSPDLVKHLSAFPKSLFDATTQQFGTFFNMHDLHEFHQLPNFDVIQQLDLRSLAFTIMEYEHEIIGTLACITRNEVRTFTEEELLLLRGLADQAALAINNTRLYKDARRRLEHLQALRAIDLAIASNHNLRDMLDILLGQITNQLNVDAAVILLLDETKRQLEFGRSLGFQTSTLRFTSLRLGEGMAGRAAQQNQPVYVRDLIDDPQTLVNAPALAREGFVSYFAAPLTSKGQVKGVLEIFHRSLLDPNEEWIAFLETLAGQAAIAIENTSLFEDLQRTNDELLKAYDATIEGWSYALDLRDKETEGHTQRVTQLTLELARMFGFSERELIYIRWGALLHDIGKMGIPDRILLKEGSLTVDEWRIMRQHPMHAHEMLRTIRYLHPALDIPYCHHEKWDGSGYPRGLKGEEIPLTARIFAVIDVWDALTSDRPYRAAWTREKTLAHIREGAGSHFDPRVVEVFTDLIDRE